MSETRCRLPAEWEPQVGAMLTWPHPGTDWANSLDRVYPVVAQIGAEIAAREILLSVCTSADHATEIRERLQAAGARRERLAFAIAPSNDTWARDHGPLTTVGGGRALLNDFHFNGWGGKFEADLDSGLSSRLRDQGSFADTAMSRRDLVLEGGAIETDGAGTLLATRSSVIGETRNPGLAGDDIERLLHNWLGLDRCLWLDHGHIDGDDTDGHIDTLARFADRDTLLYATAPAQDTDHAELTAMAAQLKALRTRDGRPYRLLPLPWPGEHRDGFGRRLPAGYANFQVINQTVLLPVFGVEQDTQAASVLARAFPGRAVAPIDCRPLIEQNGSLHCLVMHFPVPVCLSDSPGIAAA